MSTRGVVILKKEGEEKEIRVSHDAYPSGAGLDLVDLIKTTDLDALFGCMVEKDEIDIEDEDDMYCSDAPQPFSYDLCRLAVKKHRRLWIRPSAPGMIRNSLFCEYAYVVDLVKEKLIFFIGSQTEPQDDNPYGTEPVQLPHMHMPYYPCRLAAVFPLDYVKAARAERVVADMEETCHERTRVIRVFHREDLTAEECGFEEYKDQRERLFSEIDQLIRRLENIQLLVPVVHPVCVRRVDEIVYACRSLDEAVKALEEKIEIVV